MIRKIESNLQAANYESSFRKRDLQIQIAESKNEATKLKETVKKEKESLMKSLEQISNLH